MFAGIWIDVTPAAPVVTLGRVGVCAVVRLHVCAVFFCVSADGVATARFCKCRSGEDEN